MKKVLHHQFKFKGKTISANDVLTNPLFSGSAVMIIGSNLANGFAYIYHLVLGKLLTIGQYGELTAVLSIVGLIVASFSFIQMVIMKFVASAKTKEEKEALFGWFTETTVKIGSVVGVCLLLATPLIANFIHVDYLLVILIGPIFFIALFSLILKAFLQGVLKFSQNVIMSNIGLGSRFLFAVGFALMGFGVFGAILGILVAFFIELIPGKYFLRDYRFQFHKGEVHLRKKVLQYTIPVFVSTFAANAFLSTDIILVKHLFSSEEAGTYAAIANLAKIIFYATSPVSAVMFPVVSTRIAEGKPYRGVFFASIGLTTLGSLIILSMYALFPEFFITILYDQRYIAGLSLLVPFSIFLIFYTLSFMIISFYLSIDKKKVVYLGALGSILQGLGIYFFHTDLTSVIMVSIVISGLLLLSLFLYFIYESKDDKKATI